MVVKMKIGQEMSEKGIVENWKYLGNVRDISVQHRNVERDKEGKEIWEYSDIDTRQMESKDERDGLKMYLRLLITYMDGIEQIVLANYPVYLCSDTGETIEKIRY